jgi:hypothetical protein
MSSYADATPKLGDSVIIRKNLYNADDVGILGTVAAYSEGFGLTLIYVSYRADDGNVRVLPFHPQHLEPADPATLVAEARMHERMASELRKRARTMSGE